MTMTGRLVLATLAAGLMANAGAPQRPYHEIPHTASPHGRYAIAWGVPEEQVNWRKLEVEAQGEESPTLDALLDKQDAVADYLVERRTGRVLAALKGMDYWAIGVHRQNHAGLTAAWSPDGTTAVVLYDGKWTYRAVLAVALRGSRPPLQVELGAGIDRYVRAYLARRFAARYTRYGRLVAIDLSELACAGPGTYEADVIAEVPKNDDFTFEGRFHVRLSTRGGRLRVRLYGLVGHLEAPSPS